MEDEINSLDSILENGFGQDAPATEAPAPVTEQPVITSADPATTTETTPAETPAAQPEQTPEELFTGSKQNQAFAKMRTDLSSYQKLVGQFAQTLGVTAKDPAEVMQALQDRLLEYEAKSKQIPVDLLKRLEDTERRAREQEALVMRNNANLAFQRLKDTYKLNNDDLKSFAQQLLEAGKDPYSQPMDILREYQSMNFEKLLKKAQDEAAAEALKKQNISAATSTTPSRTAGKPSGPAKDIKSVGDLEGLLKDFSG
jgi:hypothetical protein